MANRRMFEKSIITSDNFMTLSYTAQILYFHLIANADDDGFIGNIKGVLRMADKTEKDLAELQEAGLSPSTYQSGKLNATGAYAHMEKRGSRYLRYALFNATRFICRWNPTFASYLEKKRSEGKHYNVAISHAAKKLVRLIFALQNSGEAFRSA